LAAIANTYQETIQSKSETVRQGDFIAGVRQMQEDESANAQVLYRMRFFASCPCNQEEEKALNVDSNEIECGCREVLFCH